MKIVLVLLIVVPFVAAGQCMPPESRTWIDYSDNSTFTERVWFGFSDSAHYGLDMWLCEIETPPSPPVGVWDIRFVNIPGREGWDTPLGLGQGFRQDYRAGNSPDGRDTFQLMFQPGTPGPPVRFQWSVPGILSIVDSAWLSDGWFSWVPMHIVDHLVITDVLGTHLLLRTFRHATGVKEPVEQLPESFTLHQNYPNPFNPTTTFQFTIVDRQLTIVNVIDVLGREVATLVNEVKEPGTYTVQWDASGLAGGIYFYRLSAGEVFETKRMVMLK